MTIAVDWDAKNQTKPKRDQNPMPSQKVTGRLSLEDISDTIFPKIKKIPFTTK